MREICGKSYDKKINRENSERSKRKTYERKQKEKVPKGK